MAGNHPPLNRKLDNHDKNGEVKAVGAMPKKTQLKALLSDAAAKHQ